MLEGNLLQFSLLAQYQYPVQQSHQHDSKMQIEYKYKEQKTSQDKRTQMWHEPGTNANVGKPLINSSYILQQFSGKREIVQFTNLIIYDSSKRALTRKVNADQQGKFDPQQNGQLQSTSSSKQQDESALKTAQKQPSQNLVKQPTCGQPQLQSTLVNAGQKSTFSLNFCAHKCGLPKQRQPSQKRSQRRSTHVGQPLDKLSINLVSWNFGLLKFRSPKISAS